MSMEHKVLLENENDRFPVIVRSRSARTTSPNEQLRRNNSLRFSCRYQPKTRMVSKRGRVRVYFKNIPRKSLHYAMDLWNTLVDMRWRWLTLIVAVVNMLAYAMCGYLFYVDSWVSGDFDNEEGHLVCMKGIQSLRNFLTLGIETVTTTGYGYVYPTENCQLYYVVLSFSTLTSIIIDGAFVSVVYAKLNRPKERNIYGQLLSKKAVISLWNGRPCLAVRINDGDGKYWINTDIRMYLISDVATKEQMITNHITELSVKPFGTLFWPVEIIHEIKSDSPLWDVSADQLMITKLELLVVVSGSSVKTGQLTISQTSYLNDEIMWGYQFSPCLIYDSAKVQYLVDKRIFHHMVPQEVPLCSAKMLADLQKHSSSREQPIK